MTSSHTYQNSRSDTTNLTVSYFQQSDMEKNIPNVIQNLAARRVQSAEFRVKQSELYCLILPTLLHSKFGSFQSRLAAKF